MDQPAADSGSIPGFEDREPARAEVDRLPGPVLLEFGTDW
jgi:hypothetical protein